MSGTNESIGLPRIQFKAPHFAGTAYLNGNFTEISIKDYAGRFIVLIFYAADFSNMCPTEIIAFSDKYRDFSMINCELIVCSTDSYYSHLAWSNIPPEQGGIGKVNIPMLADKTMKISRAYGVLNEEHGVAYRGFFIIDGKQIIRHVSVYDMMIGRNIDEILRLVNAIQFVDIHGEVCPVNWKPGDKGISTDPKKANELWEKL